MKKLLVSLALASSTLVAMSPASAQYYGDRNGRHDREYRGQDLQPRLTRIDAQISRGLERGAITPREARMLHGEVNGIWTQARQFYRTGGYNYREQAILDRRIDRLQERVRDERRDDDRRRRRY